MSRLQQAASNVQHLAKQYAAVIELGKELDKIGSLENLNAEIAAQTEKLRAGEAKALAAKDEAERAHKHALAEHEATLEQLRAERSRFIHDAKEEAKRRVADAEAQAKLVLDNAHAAAQTVADAKDELEQEFHELEGAIAERGAELKALEQRIGALKEQARAFVG